MVLAGHLAGRIYREAFIRVDPTSVDGPVSQEVLLGPTGRVWPARHQVGLHGSRSSSGKLTCIGKRPFSLCKTKHAVAGTNSV